MNKNSSVHLQYFPQLSFLANDDILVRDMDMVRSICATTLFIRDQKNLRVRLPLNQLTIIGPDASKMLAFKDIIAEEVNVKNIVIIDKINDLAELKLQINFKKVGAKFGSKMKEISNAAKEGNWQKISDSKIAIAGEILENDEFEIKLTPKISNNDPERVIIALSTNDCLIELDVRITKELEEEGLARDIIRIIQQNRKDANLDISDQIKLKVYSSNQKILEVINSFTSYITDQTLTSEIINCSLEDEISRCRYKFVNRTEDGDIILGIDS